MGHMKTLTITDAKKNLGKWLAAAVKGEDVGIISGATIVALHPIEVRPETPWDRMPIDYKYLREEYGLRKEDMERAAGALDARAKGSEKGGKSVRVENPTIENLEKAVRSHVPVSRSTRRVAGKRAR